MTGKNYSKRLVNNLLAGPSLFLRKTHLSPSLSSQGPQAPSSTAST
uniref:Angel-like protein 1 n=1 Tax=Molossus molossus TaxID=27622 RepID=A0A7J8JQ01_MOLMO|nr:angel-like protein 1 [Molossus molossus]